MSTPFVCLNSIQIQRHSDPGGCPIDHVDTHFDPNHKSVLGSLRWAYIPDAPKRALTTTNIGEPDTSDDGLPINIHEQI